MIPNIFTQITTWIDQAMLGMVNGTASNLAAWVSTIWQPLTICLVSWVGYMLIWGIKQDPWYSLTSVAIRCVIVSTVLTSSGYSTWVMGVLQTLPNDIISHMTNSTMTSPAGAFDQAIGQAWAAGVATMDNLPWAVSSFLVVVVVAIYWFAALAAIGFCYIIWLISHIVLYLFLETGPLAIPFWAFPGVRVFFERWLGAVLSSVILQVLIAASLGTLLGAEANLMRQIASSVKNGNNIQSCGVLLVGVLMFGVCAWLLKQLPAAAGSWAGGLQFSTSQAAHHTLDRAHTASQVTLSKAGGGARQLASSGVGALRARMTTPARSMSASTP